MKVITREQYRRFNQTPEGIECRRRINERMKEWYVLPEPTNEKAMEIGSSFREWRAAFNEWLANQ